MGRKRKSEHGLPSRVYLNHGAFFYVHRDGRWERLGTDLAEASRRAAHYNDTAGRYGTVVYWLDEFVIDCEARVKAGTLAPRTLQDYRDAVGSDEAPSHLRAFFAPPMTALDVQPHQVQDFLTTNAELGRAVRANRDKAALSSCMSWLIRTGKVPGLVVNPCLRSSGIKRNSEKARDRYVLHDEYRDVHACAPSSVRLLMELTYRTLQRPESDIIHWTNAAIVTEEGQRLVAFTQAKTGKRMKVKLTDELDVLIRQSLGDVPRLRQHLVHTRDGQPYTYDGLSAMLKRAIAKANQERRAKGLQLIESFGFRDLKGKGATDMWRNNVPLEDIQHLCGHEDRSTTEIYCKQRWQEVAQPNQVQIG